MGCDIHLHVEYKTRGIWEHYSLLNIQRFYSLFSKMAGVRPNHEETIVAPKGLPHGLSEITRLDYNDQRDDAHHMSWFDISEIQQLKEWYGESWNDEFGWFFGNDYNILPSFVSDVRFVFWFDNGD